MGLHDYLNIQIWKFVGLPIQRITWEQSSLQILRSAKCKKLVWIEEVLFHSSYFFSISFFLLGVVRLLPMVYIYY